LLRRRRPQLLLLLLLGRRQVTAWWLGSAAREALRHLLEGQVVHLLHKALLLCVVVQLQVV
jgi:hypothetical protein